MMNRKRAARMTTIQTTTAMATITAAVITGGGCSTMTGEGGCLDCSVVLCDFIICALFYHCR